MLDENELEQTVLSWLAGLGCTVLSGPNIAPSELLAERAEFGEVILKTRLRDALARLNPSLDATAIDEAIRKLLHPSHVSLIRNNHTIHNYLVNGVPVDIVRPDGGHGVTVGVIDFRLLQAVWCSPRSRSSSLRKRATPSPCSRTAGTSS